MISTRASVGATLSIISRTRVMALLSPIICSPFAATFFRRTFVSCFRSFDSKAFLVVINIRFRSSGFSKKSYAPIFNACTAVSTSPCPVIITIGVSIDSASPPFREGSGVGSFSALSTSIPSISGILISEKMRSYALACAISKPCLPFSATSTSCPSSARISLSVLRMPRSSSIISIFDMVVKNF